MDFTGERPSLEHEVESSRLRYKSIIPYILNKKVLDYGCGIGLGSYLLSFFSKHVYGFDPNIEAIKEAANNFIKSNLTFITYLDSVTAENIDIEIMVEVLEHIEKDQLNNLLSIHSKTIKEIACTTPDGITMPYRPMSLQERRGYHVWHYTLDELIELFKKYYTFVEVYGHLFDPKINKYTSYVIYGSNEINWDDKWLKNAKYANVAQMGEQLIRNQ